MLAGGLIPRMITKPFPRHGVTVQNGRELIALSAVKPLEASLRDGSQIGIDVRGLKPTANINRPSGTGATSPQNQSSNHKHSCSQFGFWNLIIGTYLEIGLWKFPSLEWRGQANGEDRPVPLLTLADGVIDSSGSLETRQASISIGADPQLFFRLAVTQL